MEVFLIVLLFVFLIYIKNSLDSKLDSLNSRFDRIESKFKEWDKKLDFSKTPEKPAEKTPEVPEKIISIPTPEFEKPPEVVADTREIIEEKTEKVVFETNNTIAPKPIERKTYVPAEPKKTFWENFTEKNPDLEKFIGENLINKIGILILVLGISYFVKYAIDKDWINEPARVGIGVLCGALVMGIAHKLRQNYAAFSSVLVAGAIAIFYFTIGIAFHSYHLFGQTTAFIIMVLITAFSCLISLSYDRKELAVLSLIGGFAVPFMVSTGQGNYVVLFTYIIILNIGILALAYHKKWSIINILSYAFTIILFGGWLFNDINEKNPHYLGALLFGFAFYFIFILINIINNLRTKGIFSTVELSILASNTFLFYGAGMLILEHFHPELKGLFTTIIGLLNFVYAWFLYKKFGMDKTAIYLLIGLTLTFITLAVPIQFNGHSITLFWAAEAVLLLWLSQKSKITSYLFASVIVYFLMIISLVMDWENIYPAATELNIVFNKICITGIFAVVSSFAIHYLLKNENENKELFGFVFNPIKYQIYIGVIGIILAYFVGILEISYQANSYIVAVNSAIAFPIVYHLLFSAFLFHFLLKNKFIINLQIASIIAIINIVLFSLFFSKVAFREHEQFIQTGNQQRIAFYLHYVSLLITIYFSYQLYQINKEKAVFEWFKKNTFVWVASFFIIYIASSELMLHSLVISNSPVTIQDVQNNSMYKDYGTTELPFIRQQIANNQISDTRTQIIKTGYPILWGILAFVFLIVGIKKPNKNLRIAALALLGITILKLFLFDISNASETGKIIAFILLGILILIISFVYQKIKVLVQDDNKSKQTDENE
ncbi:MAG: DUF2339 domain-containing protein [Flavobacterium sp.]|uniref:DUF2339 domain-containing protein n=1 Tax=Flavobacterium sp. TaxID=239 RepID=UPI0026100477|nr:DUF2339 domain-containing protein [Flavobacterium sp.]MDD5149496.1 DUF2339 domain-containing protein [Flavobacterium sp.]